MKSTSYWIEQLGLTPHPEGGFYKETYRAEQHIPHEGIQHSFDGPRNYSTAIYFLLRQEDKSLFHRIKSDEIWHFHSGHTLMIYVLTKNGLQMLKLGSNIEDGEQLQVIVPANHWFGARVIKGDYVLAGCTVAPGFDFADFEMATRKELIDEFPSEHEVIELLTKL